MVSAVLPSRPILRALLGAAVGFAVVLAGSAHAYADPSITDIEQQIDAEWNKLEPATGDFVRMAKIAGRPVTGYRRPA